MYFFKVSFLTIIDTKQHLQQLNKVSYFSKMVSFPFQNSVLSFQNGVLYRVSTYISKKYIKNIYKKLLI